MPALVHRDDVEGVTLSGTLPVVSEYLTLARLRSRHEVDLRDDLLGLPVLPVVLPIGHGLPQLLRRQVLLVAHPLPRAEGGVELNYQTIASFFYDPSCTVIPAVFCWARLR